MGQHKFTIPPEGYVINDSELGTGYACVIAVSFLADSQGMYILGDTFLRNFYTTFNFGKDSVEFAISANAPAGVKIETFISPMVIAAICIGSILILALLIACCLCCKRKRAAKRRTNSRDLAEIHANRVHGYTPESYE